MTTFKNKTKILRDGRTDGGIPEFKQVASALRSFEIT